MYLSLVTVVPEKRTFSIRTAATAPPCSLPDVPDDAAYRVLDGTLLIDNHWQDNTLFFPLFAFFFQEKSPKVSYILIVSQPYSLSWVEMHFFDSQ